MRRLALASILALAPVAAMAATVGVPLNQSVLVALPAPAHNVFLGNPAVADVALSDQRHVVLTGKTGGVTNLIVTDARGRTIYNREIVVGLSTANRMELIKGPSASGGSGAPSVTHYACAPTCELIAAPAPGTSTTNQSFTVTTNAPAANP